MAVNLLKIGILDYRCMGLLGGSLTASSVAEARINVITTSIWLVFRDNVVCAQLFGLFFHVIKWLSMTCMIISKCHNHNYNSDCPSVRKERMYSRIQQVRECPPQHQWPSWVKQESDRLVIVQYSSETSLSFPLTLFTNTLHPLQAHYFFPHTKHNTWGGEGGEGLFQQESIILTSAMEFLWELLVNAFHQAIFCIICSHLPELNIPHTYCPPS